MPLGEIKMFKATEISVELMNVGLIELNCDTLLAVQVHLHPPLPCLGDEHEMSKIT